MTVNVHTSTHPRAQDAGRARRGHPPGAARRGAAPDRGGRELRRAQPAQRRSGGRRRPDRLLPPLREHGRARVGARRGVVPDAARACSGRRARGPAARGHDPRARWRSSSSTCASTVSTSCSSCASARRGNVVLRHAVRNEIRLIHQRARHRPRPVPGAARMDDRGPADARGPARQHDDRDRRGDARAAAGRARRPADAAEIATSAIAEKQLRLMLLGVPQWRSVVTG